MQRLPPIRSALRRAARFLARVQLRDGELPSIVVGRGDDAGAKDSNYFTTALSVASLVRAEARGVRLPPRILERAASFLRDGRRPDGAWRFWTRKTVRLIDPDTDVTACVAAALAELGHAPAHETRDVLLGARRSDGLFVTWIRAHGPNDVDVVVNANVLWALGADAPREPAAWLESTVTGRTERASMHYYDQPVALHRAIVRAHRAGAPGLGPVVAEIRERLAFEALEPDALSIALRLAALAELDAEPPIGAVEALLAAQHEEGRWPWCPAWSGPEPPDSRELHWGSEALTTAVAIEALSRLA